MIYMKIIFNVKIKWNSGILLHDEYIGFDVRTRKFSHACSNTRSYADSLSDV